MEPLSPMRSLLDMKSWNGTKLIDEDMYRSMVLQPPNSQTEDELDDYLQRQVQDLGLDTSQISPHLDGIPSSVSASTIISDSNKQTSSILSQSTAPTSCSSSEHRPATNLSPTSAEFAPHIEAPATFSEREKRMSTGFRLGIRKMATFKKRKSLALSSSTMTSLNSDSFKTQESDHISLKSSIKSPASIKSSKSSWSNAISATKSSYEQPVPVDQDALKRGLECQEMVDIRIAQLRERGRFLEFQDALISQLRARRDGITSEKRAQNQAVLNEQHEKADKAVEDLEGRQLEEEMRLQREHENDKQRAMVRLRYMEAYCQNPTPPPTPLDPTSGRPSVDVNLPERKVTERDYHNLAQQYRERDAMDSLHASKINVLRGRQKRAVENLARKKEQEIDKLKKEQQNEIDGIDREYTSQEDRLRLALGSKRSRLERRWRMQALIERTKIERQTSLKHTALPDVLATEDISAPPITI